MTRRADRVQLAAMVGTQARSLRVAALRVRRWLAAAGAVGLAMALGACGGTARPQSPQAPTTAPAEAKPLQHVTLRQAYLTVGYTVPFVAAKEEGYYRDAGFDVDIPEGKGSATTVETVANGSDDFGFADASTAALFVSKGAPIQVVADYVQTTLLSIFYDPDHVPFKTPADLKGRTIIANPGGATLQLLPAVLARYGLKLSDVKIQATNASALQTTLARNPSDVLIDFATDFPLVLSLLPHAKYDTYAKFGVNTYNIGLVANRDMIESHPDEVRRFVAASTKGWEWALQHSAEAVALTAKDFPQVKADILGSSFDVLRDLVHTPNTEGHPLGWMAPQDWQQTIDLLHQYGGLQNVKPLDDYYTNRFVPAS